MRRATTQSGFSLIEILIGLGILTIIFSIGLLMSMDSFRGYSRRSERDTIVAMLQRTRSRAMANVGQSPWGACFNGTNYILFRGSSYASSVTTEVIEGNPAVSVTDTSSTPRFLCADGGVVFAQLTGNTNPVTITLVQGAITSTVSTNSAGRIDW